MRKPILIALVAPILLGSVGACERAKRQPEEMACVRFGPPPAVGSTYGPPTHGRGALAFTESGVRVQVDTFLWTNGGGTMNSAAIAAPPAPFGSGQVGGTNNITYVFDFSGLGWEPSSVDFVFLDQGGNENLGVNGSPVHVGELTGAPGSMGGASVTTVTNPAPGGVTGATSILGASITSVLVGGQEFWIDEVCARH